MKIASYNLKRHRAVGDLIALAEQHDLDVLCLQEAETSRLPATVAHLTRSAVTTTGDMGLAVYARSGTYRVLASRIVTLPRALHDIVLLPGIERLLVVRLEHTATGHVTTVASFHASPLSATNATRRRQIDAAHRHLAAFAGGTPTVMIGDFNYPLFRGPLERRVRRDGFELSVSDGPTYYYTPRIAYHFDFLTSSDVDVHSVTTLPLGLSDHRPILATVTPRGAAVGRPGPVRDGARDTTHDEVSVPAD